MRRPPRPFSFKIKALLVLGLLQFLGLFALGLLAYRESKEELERLAEDKFRLVTERATRELETYVRDESRRIIMLAHMPPVQSLLALRDTDDAPGWRRRLEQVFTSVINVHPQCVDLAFLDSEGSEVVRIRSAGEDGLESVRGAALRDRSAESYFRDGARTDL